MVKLVKQVTEYLFCSEFSKPSIGNLKDLCVIENHFLTTPLKSTTTDKSVGKRKGSNEIKLDCTIL